MHFEPFFGQDLVNRERMANAVHQNFGSAARKAAHAGCLQSLQNFAQRQLVELVEMPDFRRAESMKIDLGITLFQITEKLFIPFEPEGWMIAALKQNLVAAQGDSLFDFLVKFFARQNISIGIAALAIERAKIAYRGADIGVIDI